MDTALMLWGLVFSSIGFGFFLYGRRQSKPVPFFAGIALMVYPYFVNNSTIMVLIGVVLMLIPKFVKL